VCAGVAVREKEPVVTRHYIEGAGFSLERLTENVPQDGRFYLLQDGKVAAAFDEEAEARRAYLERCFSYWTEMLGSGDVCARLRAARGILRRDRQHRVALQTLAAYGDPRERSFAADTLRRLDRPQPPAAA
jgi:hypothetical protein